MAENKERVLTKGFEEAEEFDLLNSKYFSPETNVKYILTFAPIAQTVQGAEPIGYELVEKDVPDFNDKTLMVKKVALNLHVDSIDGKPVNQSWGVLAKNLRDLFKVPCQNGNLLKKKFQYQSKGEGRSKTYSLNELGDR